MSRQILACIQRILMGLCLCASFHGSEAQVITTAEVMPAVGSSFDQYPITDFIPWDTLQGPDVLWDYAWITVDSTNDLTYASIALEDAPDAAEYPEADHVLRRINGTNDDYIIDRYVDIGTNEIRELGSVGPVLSYVFDAPQTIYGSSMALEDTLSGSQCFWSDGLGIQYHFCGGSYTTFDAMGTLILPYGTYTNVKHVTQWNSSLEITIPETDSSYSITQQWFIPGVAFPILQADLFISSDGSVYASGQIMDLESLTGVAEHNAPGTVLAFPNPVSDVLTLQRSTTDAAIIEVLSADGRVVARDRFGAMEAQHSLSLGTLPAGLYTVRINGSSVLRMVKDQR